MDEFISLFDYLGHAAGPELGKQVAAYAAFRKPPIVKRFISNPKFTGEVMLYTRDFLDDFFNMSEEKRNTLYIEDIEAYENAYSWQSK